MSNLLALMVFISARETRGAPEPGPLRWGVLPPS